MNDIKRVAIIGAGASGMVSAIVASENGHIVELFEKNSRVGRKILATGNGRCNITNKNISVKNYHGLDPSFVEPSLKRFDIKRFFSLLGLEMVEGAKGRLYPMSLQASSVVDLLYHKVQNADIKVHLSHKVQNIKSINGIFIVNGREFDAVVISTGSQAMPSLGSSDSGYGFAREFRHQIIKPFASLVQLVCDDKMVTSASGVKIEANLNIFVDALSKMQVRGDLLFTNYGLSGSAILDISRVASKALTQKKEVFIVIDLLPDLSHEGLKSLLLKRSKLELPIELWLNGVVHKKLVKLIISQAKLSNTSSVNKKTINKLAYIIKNLRVKIDDTKGAKSCEVMAGGVSTYDIDPKTMGSREIEGLFFCGEVLDIDGDCGGYNLHFAFSSGYLAGSSV
jgi:predicted Rossmann fold flavoprotein